MNYNLYFFPVLLALGIASSITDMRYNKIRNKHLLFAFIAGIFIYAYLFWAGSLIFNVKLAVNISASIIIGYLLYLTKTWGPGDAKLFIAYAFLMPSSRYSNFFIFPSAALFLNIMLINTVGILTIAGISAFKNRVALYNLEVAREFLHELVKSFFTLYALSWVIEPLISRLSLNSAVLVILIYYLAYFLVFALVGVIKKFKLVLASLFISGLLLRHLFMAEGFTLGGLTENLGLALKYAIFFGLIAITIKKLNPIEKESKIPLAFFMFIGAITANTALISWAMKLLYLARR